MKLRLSLILLTGLMASQINAMDGFANLFGVFVRPTTPPNETLYDRPSGVLSQQNVTDDSNSMFKNPAISVADNKPKVECRATNRPVRETLAQGEARKLALKKLDFARKNAEISKGISAQIVKREEAMWDLCKADPSKLSDEEVSAYNKWAAQKIKDLKEEINLVEKSTSANKFTRTLQYMNANKGKIIAGTFAALILADIIYSWKHISQNEWRKCDTLSAKMNAIIRNSLTINAIKKITAKVI